jgi:hypothetical protein
VTCLKPKGTAGIIPVSRLPSFSLKTGRSMSNKTAITLCSLALLLFLVSLALPAMTPGGFFRGQTPGFACFIAGVYFYPSHLALFASPFVAASNRKWLHWATAAFLLLSFVAALALVLVFEKVYSGFWVWCSSFAVAGAALLLPMEPVENESDPALPPSEPDTSISTVPLRR